MSLIMYILVRAADFYVGLIFIYVLMSWLPNMRGWVASIYDVLGTLCEPYLGLFRRIIPPIGNGGMRLDISPIIAIVVLQLVVRLLVSFF